MRIGLALALVLLTACSRERPRERGEASAARAADGALPAPATSADAGAEVVPGADFRGVVRGVVTLAADVALPTARPPTMNGNPATSAPPCPTPDASDQRAVTRAKETGGVSPIHVAITQMSAAPPRAPRTHELFIDGCRLHPLVIGAMRGDTVRVKNRSDTALLPVLPGDSYMHGILSGETREFTLKQLGTIRVRCEFGSYCGESLVMALSHPLYAVTDADGRFAIEGLPLDQELTLHAWHPLFKVASVPFKLSGDKSEQVLSVALTPGTRAASAASPADKGKRARPVPSAR